MKSTSLILTFLPWIAYALLSKFSPALAIIFGLIISLPSYTKLKKGFVIEWLTLSYFLLSLFLVVIFKNEWFERNQSLLMLIALVLIAFISLLIKRPFTLQYAKLQIAPEFWNSPLFLRVNTIMTAVLGVCFVIMLFLNFCKLRAPEATNYTLIFALLFSFKVAFIKWFPSIYRKRALAKIKGDSQ